VGIQAANTSANQFSRFQPSLDDSTALLWTTNGSNLTNPTPTITSLSPPSVTSGGPDFTLTVNGTGFVNSSVVRWNGFDRPTTFVDSNHVTAAIPSTDITVNGSAQIAVFSLTGGVSNAVTLPIPLPQFSVNVTRNGTGTGTVS